MELEKEEELSPLSCNCTKNKEYSKLWAYKNLLGIAISFLLVRGAFNATVSLQSSLNEQIGLVSLSVLYTCFIFSIMCSSIVINVVGTKYTTLICYVFFLLYILTNFYPYWYTLIPGCISLGLLLGPSWTSQIHHITTVASLYASNLNKNPSYYIALFNGIHTFFLKLGYSSGNLASSVVFFISQTTDISEEEDLLIESTFGEVCNNTEAATVEKTYVYILFSLFLVFTLVAMIICSLFVDHIRVDDVSEAVLFKKSILNTLKMFMNWKLLMILPMVILDGLVMAFAVGTFTKKYVSDCIGIHWVGITQIAFSIFGGLSAAVNGRIVKWIPQYVIVYVMASVNIAIVLFLLLWERVPSFIVVFLLILFWGSCEGIWHSVPFSLAGILFKDDQESALAAIMIGLPAGCVIGFLSEFLLVEVQLYMALFLIVSAGFTYSVLVFKTHSKKELLPCCFKDVAVVAQHVNQVFADIENKDTIKNKQ